MNSTGIGYVLATTLLTVYGQLVVKWQVAGTTPAIGLDQQNLDSTRFLDESLGRFRFFLSVFSSVVCWMAAMTKLPLSEAHPCVLPQLNLEFDSDRVILLSKGGHFDDTISTHIYCP